MLTETVTTHPWRLQRRVLPQHTDHGGVMWHGAYVAWLEEARVEAIASAGMSYAQLSEEGYEMPVVSLCIHYRQALEHGDLVVVESMALPRRGVRWPWKSRFCRPDGSCMAEAEVELVILQVADGRRRVLRQPPVAVAGVMEALLRGGAP